MVMERPIQASLDRLHSMAGCIDLALASGRHIYCFEQSGSGISVRDTAPSPDLPAELARDIRAAEDVDQDRSLTPFSASGKVRALRRWGKEGGSGVCEELSRILLGEHRGRGLARIRAKMAVMVGCDALEGIESRREQMLDFASVVSFGNVGNLEIDGAGAAAQLFFGVDLAHATPIQFFILSSVLHAPTLYFPMRRPSEADAIVAHRRNLLKEHVEFVIQNAVAHHFIEEGEAEQDLEQFDGAFQNEEAFQAALPPSIQSIEHAVKTLVGDSNDRFLKVTAGFDPQVQHLAEAGLHSGLEHIRPLLPVDLRSEVNADVAVMNLHGEILSTINSAQSLSQCGSIFKIGLYPYALSRGVIGNMQERVLGLPADKAIATSNRLVAHELLRRVTPHLFAQFLTAASLFHVDNPALVQKQGFESIGDGADVSSTPLQVAADIRLLSEYRPGVLIGPAIIDEIIDIPSNVPLFNAGARQVFSPQVAREVGTALELGPKIGTSARALGDLARIDPGLACKTGTPHSFVWIPGIARPAVKGHGGAWIACIDSQFVIAVRVSTLHSEIPLDGGVAAGPIADEVLRNLHHYPQNAKYSTFGGFQ
jgi:membrane peptidoglycan carboxypeptidase